MYVYFYGQHPGELRARERKSAQCTHGTILVMLLTDVPDTVATWAATSRFVEPFVGTTEDVQGEAVTTDHRSRIL